MVIVRDIDRLTRNLTDWNRFEKACVRHGVLLSPYTGGGPGPVHAGGRVLRRDGNAARQAGKRDQERPVREAMDRKARAGQRNGGGS